MRYLVFSFFICLVIFQAKSQVLYPDTYLVDYMKVMELKNEGFRKRLFISPSVVSMYETDSLPKWNVWNKFYNTSKSSEIDFEVLPIISSLNFNSKYPRGFNDGAVWKGKGFNANVNFGVRGRFGILHYSLAPVIYFAQNLDVHYPVVNSSSEYKYAFSGQIDWVQQYGNSSLTKAYFGQSDIRLIYKHLTLGISTANFTYGGGQVNPIMMSTNAAMFPYVDFGTDTPMETKIGDFEFRSFWGLMFESDYFDANPKNDKRYFQSGGLYFSPSFLKGFSMGISRVHYRDWAIQKFKFADVFVSLADFSSNQDSLITTNGVEIVNDIYDQMVSANFKWKFEQIGFETFLELAKNDYSNIHTLALEPEHSRALSIGFNKLFDLESGGQFKIAYEHTVLSRSALVQVRFSPTYYVHNLAPQGYTNRGQILGAAIGPGANGDFGSLLWYTEKGMIGTNLQRIRFNDDYAMTVFQPHSDRPFDVEYTLGLQVLRFYRNLAIQGKMSLSRRPNWQYVKDNTVHNVYGELSVGYHFIKS